MLLALGIASALASLQGGYKLVWSDEFNGSNPFHAPQYILLNLAIGATGGDPSEVKFPTRYEIDYVRVYQKP
jgi:beta-glucanase (GH16 family)